MVKDTQTSGGGETEELYIHGNHPEKDRPPRVSSFLGSMRRCSASLGIDENSVDIKGVLQERLLHT